MSSDGSALAVFFVGFGANALVKKLFYVCCECGNIFQ